MNKYERFDKMVAICKAEKACCVCCPLNALCDEMDIQYSEMKNNGRGMPYLVYIKGKDADLIDNLSYVAEAKLKITLDCLQ